MPDMDGIETTRRIRAVVGDRTPVIILTSYNWDEIEAEAKAAGVDTFVAKPLFAGAVLDEFREAFNRKNKRLEKETADLRGRRILLAEDVAVNAITGSTGAGQKPGATTHFSWRADNLSIYKPFQHQHIAEILQSLRQVQGYLDASIDFIPYRGPFARGIFCTAVVRTPAPLDDIIEAYKEFYDGAAFTHYSDQPLDLKQVVNTNKALVHCEKYGNKLLITSCIDNLLKGAVGQAVQNLNLMFGLDEKAGLRLKASAF
jgi:N-acetyl-gamma-glutamylphosphate reductase